MWVVIHSENHLCPRQFSHWHTHKLLLLFVLICLLFLVQKTVLLRVYEGFYKGFSGSN